MKNFFKNKFGKIAVVSAAGIGIVLRPAVVVAIYQQHLLPVVIPRFANQLIIINKLVILIFTLKITLHGLILQFQGLLVLILLRIKTVHM